MYQYKMPYVRHNCKTRGLGTSQNLVRSPTHTDRTVSARPYISVWASTRGTRGTLGSLENSIWSALHQSLHLGVFSPAYGRAESELVITHVRLSICVAAIIPSIGCLNLKLSGQECIRQVWCFRYADTILQAVYSCSCSLAPCHLIRYFRRAWCMDCAPTSFCTVQDVASNEYTPCRTGRP